MSLSKTTKYLATTDGRDKLYKFFHYGARFLSWFVANYLNNAPLAKYFSNIEVTMSDGRKLLRLFKFIGEIEKIGLIRESKPILQVSSLLRNFGFAGYFLFNNYSWMCKFGIAGGDEKKWARFSFYAWTLGLLCALILDVSKYRENLRRQKRALGKETELANLRKEEKELQLNIIREVANLQISTSLVELNPVRNNGIVGLAGVLEAVLAAYQIWKKLI